MQAIDAALAVLDRYLELDDRVGDGPRAIAQAAVAIVKELRNDVIAGKCKDILGEYHADESLQHSECTDQSFKLLCELQVADYDPDTAKEVLGLVQKWIGGRFVQTVGSSYDSSLGGFQPDWHDIEKKTSRLAACIRLALTGIRAVQSGSDFEICSVASRLDEISFVWGPLSAHLKSDSKRYIEGVLGQAHAPHLVSIAGRTATHATAITMCIGQELLDYFEDAIECWTVDKQPWMTDADFAEIREYQEVGNPLFCEKHNYYAVEELISLFSDVDGWPEPDELLILPLAVEAEFNWVRTLAVEAEFNWVRKAVVDLLQVSKLRRVSRPNELGFPTPRDDSRLGHSTSTDHPTGSEVAEGDVDPRLPSQRFWDDASPGKRDDALPEFQDAVCGNVTLPAQGKSTPPPTVNPLDEFEKKATPRVRKLFDWLLNHPGRHKHLRVEQWYVAGADRPLEDGSLTDLVRQLDEALSKWGRKSGFKIKRYRGSKFKEAEVELVGDRQGLA